MKKLLSLMIIISGWNVQAQDSYPGERIEHPYFMRTSPLGNDDVGKELARELSELYDRTKDYPYILIKKVSYSEVHHEVKEFIDTEATYYKLWVDYGFSHDETWYAFRSFIILSRNDSYPKKKNEMMEKIPVVFYDYDHELFLPRLDYNYIEKNRFFTLPKDNQYVYICFYKEGNERKFKVINYYKYSQEKK